MNATTVSADPRSEPKPSDRWGFRNHLVWALALFLAGLGAKLWLIGRSGTTLPFWDAWDAEAVWAYIPYFEGRLSLSDLFHPLNEHRLFFTRLYCLALLLLNRQWDNQVQTVANAIIHSATLAGLGWAMARLMGRKVWPFIWPPLALALVLPFAWENTLGGGLYTQFYFLLVLSLLAIWFMGLNRPLSAAWWAGVLAAVGTLFTAGSGFLVMGAVSGLALLDILKQPQTWRKHTPTFTVSFVICIAGLLLKVEVAHHKALQAHSPGEFLVALGNNLAWPWIVVPPYAVINLFPLVLLAWMYLTSEEEQLQAEKFTLGIGGWMLLQCMAAAYARGAGGGLPFWRYMDTSSLLMITGVFSLVLLLTRYQKRLWFGAQRVWLWQAGAAGWALVCAAGLWLLCARALSLDIPEREFYERMQLKTTREFLATDDINVIANRPRAYRLRPDSAQIEAELLRNPIILKILPACVRKPLKVAPDESATRGFALHACMPAARDQPEEPSWGCCAAAGTPVRGAFASLPVEKSSLPFLVFPVASSPGAHGLSLVVVDASRKILPVPKSPRDSQPKWVDEIIKAPAGEFKLIAQNESQTAWLTFKQPRELGRLSFWATRLVHGWVLVGAASVVCLGIGLALSTRDRRWARGTSESVTQFVQGETER